MDTDRFYAELGLRLRRARTAAGLTQAELAERVGMSRAAVANIERGHQRVAAHQLVALAAAVGAEPAILLTGSGGLAARLGRALQEAGLPGEVAAWGARAAEQLETDEDGDDKAG